MRLPRHIADAGLGARAIEQRFAHLVLLLMLLPRVVYADTLGDVTGGLLVWTALGILLASPRASRIPRAIVLGSRLDLNMTRSCRPLARGTRKVSPARQVAQEPSR
ncbi:MAG: hypothetical protein SFX73_16880 [Kofleriaceae bacterium]|nr:hypothetical protein [Kofleriaceae bacterium]